MLRLESPVGAAPPPSTVEDADDPATPAPSPSPSRLWLWAAGAPLLLVAVLAWHVSMRASSDLTPWKGGGFGMFSTVDSPGTRLLRVELRGEMGNFSVALPDRYKDLAGEVTAAPAPERIRQLASLVANDMWVIPRLPGSEGQPQNPQERQLNDLAMQTMAQLMPVDAVKSIAKDKFDPNTQRRVRVAEAEVSVWRIEAGVDDRPDGGGTLRPSLIRSATAPAEIGRLR